MPLVEANAEDYTQSPFYARMPDNGFHVTGRFTGQMGMHGNERVTVFIGLGEERDAGRFCDALMEAIAKTRS